MNDVQFARRAIVPTDGNVEQVAWLKAIGTGRQRKFVAVGNGEDIELPPLPNLPGAATSPAAPHAAGVADPGDTQTGLIYTCRLTFDLGDLSPATAMIRCEFVAKQRCRGPVQRQEHFVQRIATGGNRR